MSSGSQNGQVNALLALITEAVATVQNEFSQSSKPYVPSLNDTEPHPLDTQFSSQSLIKAVRTIQGACAQLCTTVARPNHTLLNRGFNSYEIPCLRLVLSCKVPDILQEKPQGMPIAEVAERANLDKGKLGRIMRLLASQHIFREVDTDVFANNRLSVQLLSTKPIHSSILHCSEGSSWFIPEVLTDPEWSRSYAPQQTAWNRMTKFSGQQFEWLDTVEGAEQKSVLGLAMVGFGEGIQGHAVTQDFPWNELSPGTTVCDVGGGIGHISMPLAKAHPHLKLKLQDLPASIEQARSTIWPKECPEAIAEDRIEFKAIDFFKEAPIEGCDIYFVKNIIHDWPDKESVIILSNIRKAMKPSSRLLIEEFVLQELGGKDAVESAPEPLLPNYGAGKILHYKVDLTMLAVLNSKERTLNEFIELGKQANLEFVKLWNVGELGALEFRV